MKIEYDKEEKVIAEAITHAREVQEYIWQELSYYGRPFIPNLDLWYSVFQKRVDKIKIINMDHPNSKVELRKRVLQQASLSIIALKMIDDDTNKS